MRTVASAILVLSTCLAPFGAVAQGRLVPTRGSGASENGEDATKPREPLRFTRYTKRDARRLFAVLDNDADDRLDLLEASAGMGTLEEPADIPVFRRLDSDRDGFLSFPEFDHHFKMAIAQEQIFVAHPSRPSTLRPRKAGSVVKKPMQLRVMEWIDKNGDGTLDKAEFADLLALGGRPASDVTVFLTLDTNGDGAMELSELKPIVSRFPSLVATIQGNENSGQAAPNSRTAKYLFERGDTNRDSVWSLEEVRAVLLEIDPFLARLAERVLTDADADGDGRLENAEVEAATKLQVRSQRR